MFFINNIKFYHIYPIFIFFVYVFFFIIMFFIVIFIFFFNNLICLKNCLCNKILIIFDMIFVLIFIGFIYIELDRIMDKLCCSFPILLSDFYCFGVFLMSMFRMFWIRCYYLHQNLNFL